MSRTKIRKPNSVVYCAVFILFYPLLKVFFRLEVDRGDYRPPKGPFIVVSNHQSFMDFLLTMLSLYPRRLNAVAARKFFFYRPLHKLLPFMGCIPKNLFDPDIASIRGIMAVINRGGRILLFPEGRCSVDGTYMGMHKATGKLIKKVGVPVISCYIEGSYNCMPLWRKGFRPGRGRVTLANLFSAEDTRRLSVDEINSRIDARLSGVDTRAPKKPFRVFPTRSLAKGLQNILYYCPNCKREFTLETRGNIIRCANCGNAAALDRSAKLHPTPGSVAPETVHKWYREQARHEMQSLHDDMEPIRLRVTVRMPAAPGRGLKYCGRGTLSLHPGGWHYTGELRGESVRLFFPIESVPAIPIDPNDNFQIYANGNFYVFRPESNPRACIKYATVGECAYQRFSASRQMTEGYDGGCFTGNPY